jgi:hypothetical protein
MCDALACLAAPGKKLLVDTGTDGGFGSVRAESSYEKGPSRGGGEGMAGRFVEQYGLGSCWVLKWYNFFILTFF